MSDVWQTEIYLEKALQGDTDAQRILGDCYYYGRGIDQDYAQAVRWYERAAAKGNAQAQCNLGVCCFSGTGTPRNEYRAVHYFEKAAAQIGRASCRERV